MSYVSSLYHIVFSTYCRDDEKQAGHLGVAGLFSEIVRFLVEINLIFFT